MNVPFVKDVRQIQKRLKNAAKWPEVRWPIWPFNQFSEPNKHYKREIHCRSRQVCVCVYSCVSTTILLLYAVLQHCPYLRNFSVAWVYKISDSDVWLRRQRSTLKLLTEWPKADRAFVREYQAYKCYVMCFGEKYNEVGLMNQEAANPVKIWKQCQTKSEKSCSSSPAFYVFGQYFLPKCLTLS